MLYPKDFTEALYATAIGKAVLPLRDVAMQRARDDARARIERMNVKLEEAGMDAKIVAPYPNASRMSRNDYLAAKARYSAYRSFNRSVKGSLRLDEPELRTAPIAEAVEKLVESAAEMAAASYDAFAAKLLAKVGEHTEATLEGNHVWGWSFLTVKTAAGEVQIWKTQQIGNISKLGLAFPQWPSRKVKAKK